ncbi:MAG: DUF6624 domain-containing protein [Bacteroidota bacterium]
MLRLVAFLAVLAAPAAASQTTPPDVLADSVRQHLQVELREMNRIDQRVRYMVEYGTFSPCVADSIGRVLAGLPIEENIAMSQRLRAEREARTTPVERAVLLQRMRDTDRVILERLRDIIAEHGWPSDERTGADANPEVFLLHAPHAIDEMTPVLLAEVTAGRLPARHFAMAVDKSRKVRGELQLYGTADEYDPATGSIEPPRVADIEATNAARAEIGLAPLERYRLAP